MQEEDKKHLHYDRTPARIKKDDNFGTGVAIHQESWKRPLKVGASGKGRLERLKIVLDCEVGDEDYSENKKDVSKQG